MYISIIRTLILFTISLDVILGADQAFMRLMEGSIFMNSEGNQKWTQIKADLSIRAGDVFKTSSDFRGNLYISNQSLALSSSGHYSFRKEGIYQEKDGEWYSISSLTSDFLSRKINNQNIKLRGELRPENYVLLTRAGQFERRRIDTRFNVLSGDIVELPRSNRAELVFVDGSQLLIDARSSLELGYDGIFLQSGSVFCTIRNQLSRFEVTTPNLLAAVRGTTFEVSHKDESRVRVFEGVVKVNNRNLRSRSIFLRRGQQASLDSKKDKILSSDFSEQNRPIYSRAIFDSRFRESTDYASKGKHSELQNLKNIQNKLRQSKGMGFGEYVSSAAEERSNAGSFSRVRDYSKDVKSSSLQSYLRKVAKPGEDADFKVFQGATASQGISQVVESWKDDYREEVQSSTLLQRQKVDGQAQNIKNRREVLERREKDLSVDLRTQIQQKDFSRRAFRMGTREITDQNQTNREIMNLRKFRNIQALELQRIQQEKLRLTRDKELIDRKISSVELSLNNNPAQSTSLQVTLSALRIQKRQLDTIQKNLNNRENNAKNVLKKTDSRIQEVLSGFAGRFRRDDQFNKDSRRLLIGR